MTSRNSTTEPGQPWVNTTRERVRLRRRGVEHLDADAVRRAGVGHEAQLLVAVELGLDAPPVVVVGPVRGTRSWT